MGGIAGVEGVPAKVCQRCGHPERLQCLFIRLNEEGF
jgi:hypothetical protein